MLFVVMLGGKHPQARIEVHDVVFAIADTLQGTHEQLRQAWFGSPSGLHIDSWMAVDGIDDYRIELSNLAPAADAPRLYFLNLGGYQRGAFGEEHHYLLLVASDKREAKTKGKQRMLAQWDKAHTDALLEVDDCIPIDHVDGRYIHLRQGSHRGIRQHNDYIILS
ncbi:MAG TPA: DUF1543 domain-containing protein [Pseudomonas sp.]|nr:DUF1543 domain-containing protein [Pseudomonas sp.]